MQRVTQTVRNLPPHHPEATLVHEAYRLEELIPAAARYMRVVVLLFQGGIWARYDCSVVGIVYVVAKVWFPTLMSNQ